MVPLVFIGLVLGWKYPKAGGFLIVIPVAIGFVVGLLTEANLTINLAASLVPGILYLVDGYNRGRLNS